MTTDRVYAVDQNTGDVVYRIPGYHHGDGQVDTDESPVWLLAGDQGPEDCDELPYVSVQE